VPGIWKFGMAILVVCLVASMVIAIVRLATTPTEILGAGFQNLTRGYEYETADGTVLVAGAKPKPGAEAAKP
jgi:hypothetical protein